MVMCYKHLKDVFRLSYIKRLGCLKQGVNNLLKILKISSNCFHVNSIFETQICFTFSHIYGIYKKIIKVC